MRSYHGIATLFSCTAMLFLLIGCADEENSSPFVFVEGGTFVNETSNLYGKNVSLSDFYMGKHEVTQKEWKEIMDYNPSQFKGDSLPVEMVSWYEAVEYCNKRSTKEGLQPYYTIDKNTQDTLNKNDLDSIKWSVSINPESDGYRLPTEVEWEYAAGGGQRSKSYTYSGSNEIDEVAWYWRNSGDTTLTGSWSWTQIENNDSRTHAVGLKKPNELGIYDMSGNVREWCEEWYVDINMEPGYVRAVRGGGWLGGEHTCVTSFRGSFDASGYGPDQGFRVCRSGM